MHEQTLKYREAELIAAAPLPVSECGALSIQLVSGRGKSKFLGITPAEFKRIELVLLGGKVEGE
jgi:hypothetical protein